MRIHVLCICVNKGTDQLCSNCTTDQRLCFLYSCRVPLFLPSKIVQFPIFLILKCQASDCTSVHAGFCRPQLETLHGSIIANGDKEEVSFQMRPVINHYQTMKTRPQALAQNQGPLNSPHYPACPLLDQGRGQDSCPPCLEVLWVLDLWDRWGRCQWDLWGLWVS